MLKTKAGPVFTSDRSEVESFHIANFDFTSIFRTIRRQWPLIISVLLVCIGLAALAYWLSPSKYTATALVMIDTHQNQFAQGNNTTPMPQMLDPGLVDSQVEILQSESVALSVINDLKLVSNPVFMDSPSLIRKLINFIMPSSQEKSAKEVERQAVDIFGRNLDVRREGTSYAIKIAVTTLSPSLSAKIANGITDAYMVGELDAKYQATMRASKWLQNRINELREQATQADREVQTFKSTNNIVNTNRGLMNDQQLADVNSQLITARAVTADAKARLDRIKSIANGDSPEATVGDALRNDVINRLRSQYLDLATKARDWAEHYGAKHAAVVNLRNQMREIKGSISDELQRIAETYKSDYEIAQAREASLQQSLAELIDQAGATAQQQVKLRDLESNAQTYRNLYDNFLQRFTEATQQQSFPITDARVITVASEPLQKSRPKPLVFFGGGILMGLILGFGAGYLREYLDNVFRSIDQVEKATGLECLGILPKVYPIENPQAKPVRFAAANGYQLPTDLGLTHQVIQAPFSRYAETLRSVKVAIDVNALAHGQRSVIGALSAVPREGKSTTISNLAELIASSGQRVLLIDGDLRHPSLSAQLCPEAAEGLLEVLAGTRKEEEVVWTDPLTGLHFLPAVVPNRISHTAELISSMAMANLLAWARRQYDYVLLDLPPVLSVVDVRAVAHLIDGFVLVVEWGKTSQDAVLEALNANELVRDRTLGVVLNNAHSAALKRIESYKGRHYEIYYTASDGGQGNGTTGLPSQPGWRFPIRSRNS